MYRLKTMDKGILQKGSEVSIPISVLADRSVASLEAVVEYLKDSLHLTYHEIAELLNRDDRTIWTCYNRAKQKRAKK